MPWLQAYGDARELGEEYLSVGSGSGSSWQMDGRGLAPSHFTVRNAGGRIALTVDDMEAAVLVNGLPVDMAPVPLHVGDTIQAGSELFTVTASPDIRRRRLSPEGENLVLRGLTRRGDPVFDVPETPESRRARYTGGVVVLLLLLLGAWLFREPLFDRNALIRMLLRNVR